jgi:hypothetical protein
MEPIDDPKADLSSADRTAGQGGDALELPRKGGARNGKARIQSYTWILITTWTPIMVISLGWNLYQARQETQDMALTTARINFDKDLLYRRWARHPWRGLRPGDAGDASEPPPRKRAGAGPDHPFRSAIDFNESGLHDQAGIYLQP